MSVIENRYLSKFVGAQRRREMHIYWQIYDFQQKEQHLLFPFVLSLSSLLLPTTSFFGSSNFLTLSLFPSHKSRRVTEEGRISRSLVEELTMSFTGSPSLSCSKTFIHQISPTFILFFCIHSLSMFIHFHFHVFPGRVSKEVLLVP